MIPVDAKVTRRFWSKVNKDGPTQPHMDTSCWVWTAAMMRRGGYGTLQVGRRVKKAHRIAWVLMNGQIPADLCVLHRCDNPPCVNPSHLFLGTNAENVDDRMKKGRHVASPGIRNGRAKLTEDEVRSIRELHRQGWRPVALRRRFCIGGTMIREIINHTKWKHVV